MIERVVLWRVTAGLFFVLSLATNLAVATTDDFALRDGDTADGALKRLERDVFAHKATVLLVMFGTNDIGWGVYADDEHKQRFLNAIRTIVLACKERNVRVYVCSEPVTAADPHKSEGERLEFTRLDEGLPFNHGLFFALQFRFVPFPSELNRYLLSVKNLPVGKYEVLADERSVATFTAQQLANGVNVASMTANAWEPGGPWNAQADVLVSLTNARHDLATSELLSRLYLKTGDLPQKLAGKASITNEQLEEMQRFVARPRPYRFVISPAKAPDKPQ